MEYRAKAFFGYPFGASRKKASTIFYDTAIFFQFSADGLHDWGVLLVISLESQEIRQQPFSMAQPFVTDPE